MRRRLLASIRFRLMIWYLAIVALILGLFTVGVFVTLGATLSENLDDSLHTRAALLQGLISLDDAGRPQLSITTDPNDPRLRESFQRLFDADGAAVFDDSAAFGQVATGGLGSSAAPDHQTLQTFGHGGSAVRVLTVPILREGRPVGTLQVGQSAADLNHTRDRLLFVLAIAVPVALVLSSVGGLWLSARALRPIDRITRAAREISGHDLSRRLDLDLPDDEVGRLARTFDEMIGRLEQMFQRQRRFTADASHELRTPLTAIRGQVDVALQPPRDLASDEQAFTEINKQAERMTRLVGALLMLARTDEGAIPVQSERVRLDDLVASVANQMRPLAEQKGLKMHIEAGQPVSIAGDADLLLQLLLNLVDNAVKYTEKGAVTLGWRTNGDGVRLFVADTGAGIPTEHRDRIFERFHRVDAARSRDQGGAGLGLAISKWIVDAHGGTITVESNGAGSTFVVRLPSGEHSRD